MRLALHVPPSPIALMCLIVDEAASSVGGSYFQHKSFAAFVSSVAGHYLVTVSHDKELYSYLYRAILLNSG